MQMLERACRAVWMLGFYFYGPGKSSTGRLGSFFRDFMNIRHKRRLSSTVPLVDHVAPTAGGNGDQKVNVHRSTRGDL